MFFGSADGDDYTACALEAVAVGNSYFEPTPLEYFTGVVTELGVLSGTEASLCARKACIDLMLIDALQNLRDGIR